MKNNLLIVFLLILFLGIVAFSAKAFFSRYPELTSENLDAFLRSLGGWAVAAFVFTYTIASPIPFLTPLLSATGGLLFGPWAGLLVVVLTATATSLIPFSIARQLGREWVQAKLKGGKVENFILRIDGGKGFRFTLLLRLVAVLPFEMQNYIAGVSKVDLVPYLMATLVGILPLRFGLVLVGTAARQPGSWQFIASLALPALALLIPTAVVLIQLRKNEKPDTDPDSAL